MMPGAQGCMDDTSFNLTADVSTKCLKPSDIFNMTFCSPKRSICKLFEETTIYFVVPLKHEISEDCISFVYKA